MNSIVTWLLVIICSIFFIVCDSLVANWGKTGSILSLSMAVLLAPISYILFGLLNKKYDLSIASGLVNTMILVGALLIGVIYFKESLNLRQSIGICFAVVSVLLLSF